MKFYFKAEDVRARLAHSKEADARKLLYGIRGTDEPGIWLVKDQGVYIMSNAKPAELVDPSRPNDSACVVNYAKGHDPDKDEDWWVGGDDYVKLFTAEQLEPELTEDVDKVMFEVTESRIRVFFS